MRKQKFIAMAVALIMLAASLPILSFAEPASITSEEPTAVSTVGEQTEPADELAEQTETEEKVEESENDQINLVSENYTNIDNENINLEDQQIMAASAGSGSVYYISDAEGLNSVRNDLYGTYYLTQDIDLSNYGEWEPIGDSSNQFIGQFNGQGHKITGLGINSSERSCVGLFGYVYQGTITNLGVESSIKTETDYVGLLTGEVDFGTITNCYTAGSVEGKENVGGLIGYSLSSHIENCYSRTSITGVKSGESDYLGGLIGYVNSGTVKRCYATGYIRPRNDNAEYGGLMGRYYSNKVSLFNYYDQTTSKAFDTNRSFNATTEQMKDQNTFTGWDFENVWGISPDINDGYPYLKFGESEYYENAGSGSKSDPYMIHTVDDLIAITDGKIGQKGSYYELADDIVIDVPFWTPIGGNDNGRGFEGIFNGAGHVISGLNITYNNFSYTGLFGQVSGTITNLGVDGNISTTTDNIGLLAGSLGDIGCITNCYTTGSVEAKERVGGLIGSSYGTVENCYSRASVTGLKTGESNYMGGLIGGAGGTVKRCYSTGFVSPKNNKAIYGGLMGSCSNSLFNYYDQTTAKATDTDKSFAVSTAQMKDPHTFTGWDFENVWGVSPDINDGYPYLKFGEYKYYNIGSGTQYDPYMIYSVEDLIAITEGSIGQSGSYYELANDILLDVPFWTPIGGNKSGRDFNGIFNGNGHKISGLNITQDNFENTGLFGEISSGTIKNLGISGSITLTTDYVGLLAGRAKSGSKITNCYTTGSVKANQYVGGLIGSNYLNSDIENCYSRSVITGSSHLGGLIGSGNGVKRCYAAGRVESQNINNDCGGLVGSGSSVLFSYYDRTTSATTDTNKGFAATTKQMKDPHTFTGWDFKDVWGISPNINDGYPYLKFGEYQYSNSGTGLKNDPYSISSIEDLVAVTEGSIGFKDAYYELKNDIIIDVPFWTPIGGNDCERDFDGNFNGNGYIISGLNMTQDNFTYSGLFGEVTGTITNLGVDGNITLTTNYAGLLAGHLESGSITNCYSIGSVKAKEYVGGLIGRLYSNTISIENCYSRANVNGYRYIGGLIGSGYGGKIRNCYAAGSITPDNGANDIGGFIGWRSSYTEITACYYDQNASGRTDEDNGIGLSTEDAKKQSSYAEWDFANVWAISADKNSRYPYLRAVEPREVSVPPTPTPTQTPPAAEKLTGIRVAAQPAKTSVVEGMALDTSGLKVEAVYNNSKAYEISDYTLSGYDMDRIGAQTITVEYMGYTASFNITVTRKSMTGLVISQKPNKRAYMQGERLDTSGMVVTAMYNNGTSEEISGYKVSGYDPNYIGSQTISVSYNGFSTAFTVTVSKKEQTSGTVETPKIGISSFIGGKTVTLTCADADAKIYYTDDGSAPSEGSARYTGPITLHETKTIKAIAAKSGAENSKTASGKITVAKTEKPTASHSAGQVEAGTVVTLRSATSGAMIYYTTDGTAPNTESKRYSGGIAVTSNVTIKAMAVKSGNTNSDVFEISYTVPEIQRGSASVSLGSAAGCAGDNISVPIYIFAEEKISGYRLTINYDSDKFEYRSITPAEGANASDLFTSASEGKVTVLYSGAAIESGEMCGINLKALESDEDGEYPITIDKGSVKITTESGAGLDADITDGAITLEGSINSNLKTDVMLTDSDGNDISDKSEAKGEVTANVTLGNISESAEPLTVNMIMAVYDRQGCLVSMSVMDADLSDLNYVFTNTVDIPEGVEVGSIKLMVWNGLSDMAPMSAASTIL